MPRGLVPMPEKVQASAPAPALDCALLHALPRKKYSCHCDGAIEQTHLLVFVADQLLAHQPRLLQLECAPARSGWPSAATRPRRAATTPRSARRLACQRASRKLAPSKVRAGALELSYSEARVLLPLRHHGGQPQRALGGCLAGVAGAHHAVDTLPGHGRQDRHDQQRDQHLDQRESGGLCAWLGPLVFSSGRSRSTRS